MTSQEKIIVLYLADGKYQLSYGVTLMDAALRAGLTLTQIRRYSWENDFTFMWSGINWVSRDNLEIRTAIKVYRETIQNASPAVKAALVGEISPEVAQEAAEARARIEANEAAKITAAASAVDEDAVAAEKAKE